ncbi:MAG: histidinol dehydrogenase, partial [Thermoleophilia bacterium]|nr:histidinol dehydrogenase [Thermoleophilia bacterium]
MSVRRVHLRAGGADVLAATLRPEPVAEDISEVVAGIITDVRARGDAAMVDDARRFGSPHFAVQQLRVPPAACDAAAAALPPDLRAAILAAAAQVRTLAEATLPGDREVTLPYGQRVTVRSVPVDSAGCYVPGGRAAYP